MPELLFRNLDHACRSGRMWWINILYSQLIATVSLLTNATTCTFDNSSFIICYICSKTRLKLWSFWTKLFMIVKWSTFLCLCWPQNSWVGEQNSYIIACIWWSCAWIFAVCLWECVSNGVVWVCVIEKAVLTHMVVDEDIKQLSSQRCRLCLHSFSFQPSLDSFVSISTCIHLRHQGQHVAM